MIIEMMVKEYYGKTYAHKFGNLDEMNLETNCQNSANKNWQSE